MNKELVKEEMAHKFWNEINEAKWGRYTNR